MARRRPGEDLEKTWRRTGESHGWRRCQPLCQPPVDVGLSNIGYSIVVTVTINSTRIGVTRLGIARGIDLSWI